MSISTSMAQRLFVASICVILLMSMLNAQVSVSGSMTGTVVDGSGAVIPGAAIKFYAQDQWKVSRRLTLSYGAHFSYMEFYRLRDGQHGLMFAFGAYNPANTPRLYVAGMVGGNA